ncbi:hypothetical protein SESBI_30823 [Sesbania bispinosa]|nr:hypothetical protein SESBI_30823 [Sesbania bispinosa]
MHNGGACETNYDPFRYFLTGIGVVWEILMKFSSNLRMIGSMHPLQHMRMTLFRDFLDDIGLMDLELQGCKYTWYNNPWVGADEELAKLKQQLETLLNFPYGNMDWRKIQEGFFATGNLQEKLNEILATLVPKIPRPESTNQLRPTSCCNFMYKMMLYSLPRPPPRKLISSLESSTIFPPPQVKSGIIFSHGTSPPLKVGFNKHLPLPSENLNRNVVAW